ETAARLSILRVLDDLPAPGRPKQQRQRSKKSSKRKQNIPAHKIRLIECDLLEVVDESVQAGSNNHIQQHLPHIHFLRQKHDEPPATSSKKPSRVPLPPNGWRSRGIAIRAVATGLKPPMMARVCEASPPLSAA